MHVDIYSDIACPWCYIGERRFARALAAFPQSDQVEIVFRPYQLDPSLSETPIPLKVRLQDKFGPRLETVLRHTASTAKKEGLDFHFEEALAVNTLTAHRLLWLAAQEYGADVQRTLANRLFEAHFTNGENVADPELLADLAAQVGMAGKRVVAFLASDEGLREVQEEIAQAQRLGIRAVPTFVFDGRVAIQGAQPASAFLQVLEEVHQEATASNLDESTDDACAEGSCAA
ncbi:MAG: DsbA family oxidoreductase [Bacteroidetes bacterium]|jgi:predicted DsbA family dithiol-disulfide isomerase|nr:DsbA family oxidoreductase [Bacteroidota bacterium]